MLTDSFVQEYNMLLSIKNWEYMLCSVTQLH
uniref:Uncharacterized protein n=1 Tax=Rhizophora mucronata TaxID=61149 RepID=A0A2P2R1Z1_RHIMU